MKSNDNSRAVSRQNLSSDSHQLSKSTVLLKAVDQPNKFANTVKLQKNFKNFGQGERISVEVMEDLLSYLSRGSDRRVILQKIIKDMRDKGMLTEDAIICSFKMYDTDGSGTISRDEIRQIVKLSGEDDDMKDSEIEEMIRESDIDGDGEIDLKEFTKVILGG